MEYLTLPEIKKQCNIDPQFTEDDEFLTLLGESAEDMVAQLLDNSLDEVTAMNGDLPPSVRHAMRMLVDYMYSQNRGSSGESIDIPNAIYTILKLYRSYH